MMTAKEVIEFLVKFGLNNKAIRKIKEIRNLPPARNVENLWGNVRSRYASIKMGFTMLVESHTVELPRILLLEHDQDVYEYYDQPCKIKLHFQTPSGNRACWHTPDIFVISKYFVGFEECKPEERLEKLEESRPYRYRKDEKGNWTCPPGEAAAAEFGLSYRVISSASFNPIKLDNLRFLDDFKMVGADSLDPQTCSRLTNLVSATPGILLGKLLEKLSQDELDALYVMILRNQLFVDLECDRLTQPDTTRIYITKTQYEIEKSRLDKRQLDLFPHSSAVQLEPGKSILWDGQPWIIQNVGVNKVFLVSARNQSSSLDTAIFEALVQEGTITSTEKSRGNDRENIATAIVLSASDRDLKSARDRLEIIKPYLDNPTRGAIRRMPRTHRRWLKRYQQSEITFANGFIGLIPKTYKQGNCKTHLPEEVREAAIEHIKNDYEGPEQKTIIASYRLFTKLCKHEGIDTCSYVTYARMVGNRPIYEQTLKRKGKRAAYQRAARIDPALIAPPVSRVFEVAHIDHTQLDIEIVSNVDGRPLGRPWLTLMVDSYSRSILAATISFDPPGYRACMAVMRECVRRHGRLPDTLMVDNGPEFDSTDFETLLANYAINKKQPPASQPRFDSRGERLFKTINTGLLYNLSGNTQSTKDPRQLSASHNPKKLACWSITAFHARLVEWAYEVYDQSVHSELGCSPKELFDRSLATAGPRGHRLIPYDELFVILTSPSTPRGKAKVDPVRGVKINRIYYWANEFRNPNVAGQSVPVRYNPDDVSEAYAFVNNHWIHCLSQYTAVFRGRSYREIKLASDAIRANKAAGAKAPTVNAAKLAEFLTNLKDEEVILQQQRRDNELASVKTKPALQESSMEIDETSDDDFISDDLELLEDF